MDFIVSQFSCYGKQLLLALLLAAAALHCPAQDAILTGVVSDDIEILFGASVKATQDSGFVRGVITDEQGVFRMSLPPGVYNIEISYTGYMPVKFAGVCVLQGQENRLSPVVMKNAVLSEVVITAYKVPLIKQDRTSSAQTLTSVDRKSRAKRRSKARNGRRENYVELSKLRTATNAVPQKDHKDVRDSIPRDPYPGEQYNAITENPFQDAQTANISTFSIDVDQASYANIRRYLKLGTRPPANAVRIEEMINYFDYQYPVPAGEHPVEATVELGPCPWNASNRLMLVGLQGRKVDNGQLPPSNFVFLVDVSGSMADENKLPLVQKSLSMLTDQMRPNDRVALVVYAGAAGLVLESTPGTEKEKIKKAIALLSAGGSTAGGEGIKLAYATALKNFIPGGNNRVVLCTDGDFNVGVSTEGGLVRLIERKRKSGVFLTVLGFGEGNYQDGKMQALADKGNGNHAYIDQVEEARKVLIDELGGTLFAIAKDVKLQLHFNPELVAGYRLIGYENRMLATEDFDDDTKDAGEMGAGHRVTALYEIVPKGNALPPLAKQDAALVMSRNPTKSVRLQPSDLMVLQLRYKKPSGFFSSRLMEYRLNGASLNNKQTSENFQLAAAVAEFGLLLRQSTYKGSASYAQVRGRLQLLLSHDPGGYRAELLGLVMQADK